MLPLEFNVVRLDSFAPLPAITEPRDANDAEVVLEVADVLDANAAAR